MMLLSISKGGMRQVLQLDSTADDSPWRRVLAETRSGAVRGYIDRNNGTPANGENHIGRWLGHQLRLSTVRDLGFGAPYISTVAHDSNFLADHLINYLNQSVQIRADIILHGDLAIMIEAMPGCDDDDWFKAVESMAKIPSAALDLDSPEQILTRFETLHVKQAGCDHYAYQCSCSRDKMLSTINSMSHDDLDHLVDANGQINVTCQYCASLYTLDHQVDPKRLQ